MLDVREIAERNSYAKRLSELSEKKIWNGVNAVRDIGIEGQSDDFNFYFSVIVCDYGGNQLNYTAFGNNW